MYTNPLNNIRIASPCRSDWNEMYGDDRTRFCSECKLNVYNLSGMSRAEAESLLINAEGRLCVRFYRRSDGTVLTKDCPVGWRVVRKRVSTAAGAFASLVVGLVAGMLGMRATDAVISMMPVGDVPPVEIEEPAGEWLEGQVPVIGEAYLPDDDGYAVGRVAPIQKLQEVKVKMWVK